MPSSSEPTSAHSKTAKIEVLRLPRLLYTYSEVAAVFSVSSSCIEELAARGELRKVFIGHRVRITYDSVLGLAGRLGLREIPVSPASADLPQVLLTYRQASEMLHCHESSVANLVEKRQLEMVIVSDLRRITVESIRGAIDRMGEPA